MIAAIVIGIGVASVWLYVDRRTKEGCDRAAESDAIHLASALERLRIEMIDLQCPPPNVSRKHLAYLVGPYYGWRGTSPKCDVRVRVKDGVALFCSPRGKRPEGKKSRYLYGVVLNSSGQLPAIGGECYGDMYGVGRDALCYTDSIAESFCPTLRKSVQDRPTAETCELIRRENKDRDKAIRSLASKGVNAFGVELYRRLVHEDDSLIVSPFGYYLPLAMAYAGAREATLTQMTNVMRLQRVGPELHPSLAALTKELQCSMVGTDGRFDLDSLLVVRQGQPILREFKELILANYGLDLDTRQFGEPSAHSASTVPDRSSARRPQSERIASGVQHQDTSLVIESTIKFDGTWSDDHSFDESATAEAPFYPLKGSAIQVPTMFRQGRFRYLETKDFQALELMYQGNDISMVVFLPRERKGLPELEKAVTPEALAKWLGQLDFWPAGVKVYLPRFQLSSSLHLAETLVAMGMKDAFCSRYKGCTAGKTANFSGISGRLDSKVEQPLTDLFLTDALQIVSLDVTEKGTEIRAKSVLCAQLSGANGDGPSGGPPEPLPPPPQPKEFKADHPFLFLVRHNPSNTIVFLGRLTAPL